MKTMESGQRLKGDLESATDADELVNAGNETVSQLRARLAAYSEAGVGHILVEPAERALEDWLHRHVH